MYLASDRSDVATHPHHEHRDAACILRRAPLAMQQWYQDSMCTIP